VTGVWSETENAENLQKIKNRISLQVQKAGCRLDLNFKEEWFFNCASCCFSASCDEMPGSKKKTAKPAQPAKRGVRDDGDEGGDSLDEGAAGGGGKRAAMNNVKTLAFIKLLNLHRTLWST